MNYLELIKKFWKKNSSNDPFGRSSITLYFFLLNKSLELNNHIVKISDVQVCKIIGISRPALVKAKQSLKTLGIIEFISKNGLPTQYTILDDYNDSEIMVKSDSKLKSELLSLQISESKIEIKKSSERLSLLIPTEEEFIEFAKTLELYKTYYTEDLDFKIKEKYNFWKALGWKTSQGKAITTWKPLLKSVMFNIIEDNSSSSKVNIPLIKRPKAPKN